MNTKICKVALPATMIALAACSGPAPARDDLGNCTAPLRPYVDRTVIKPPARELFILIDQTVRFDDKLRKALLKQTLDYVRQGDRITVASFSAYANKHYTELVFSGTMDAALPDSALEHVPVKRAKTFKRCLNAQWDQGRKSMVKHMLAATTGPDDEYDFSNTELVSAINTLATDLIGKSGAKDRSLLIFSDMLENSRMLTVFQKGAIRLINPDTELAKVSKAGMIPALDRIKVYVMGGGWLDDGSLYQDSRKLKALRSFWEKFFTSSHARLEGFGEPMLLTEIR